MIKVKRYIPVHVVLGVLTLLLTSVFPIMSQEKKDVVGANMLESLSKENLGGFAWINEPRQYEFSEGQLAITAERGTDFFINPEDETSVATAPYLYREVKGDFIAIAQVKPNFREVWNACSLLLHIDEHNWIKLAYENSDATGPGIVSVVTRGVSDDANGVFLENQTTLWLKLIRKGSIYAMHWSNDGINYKLARLAAMPNKEIVKVGMEAQCPSKGPAVHVFLHFSVQNKTVEDLRKGL